MAIEQPSYRVLAKDGAFELRHYGPELVAETRVKADFDAAGGEAFRRLLRYISGYNRSQGKIPMTAPVTQVPADSEGAGSGEAIPMTAPVDQVRDGDDYRVAFLMPAAYTESSLPVPLDPTVHIRQVPARLLASWTYSGRWTQSRYEEMERALRQTLAAHHLVAVGAPIFARYDAPFIPWPFRRNEVLIPVRPESSLP